MRDMHEYFRGILNQILDSYAVIENLSDKPADLEVLQIEMAKIMGFFTIRKRDKMNDISNEFSNLQKIISVYLKNYDFSREIELLLRTFSEDQNRVKNIRIAVLNSLKDKKLIDEIYTESKEL
jgi:hypothetical protein